MSVLVHHPQILPLGRVIEINVKGEIAMRNQNAIKRPTNSSEALIKINAAYAHTTAATIKIVTAAPLLLALSVANCCGLSAFTSVAEMVRSLTSPIAVLLCG